VSAAVLYNAGHRGVCAGCGAYAHELCLCGLCDDRAPTPAELEQSRQERLSQHEREVES
jgi:hypothetical protein